MTIPLRPPRVPVPVHFAMLYGTVTTVELQLWKLGTPTRGSNGRCRSVLRQVDEARAERSERVCQGSEIVLEIKKSKDGRGVVARNQKEYISHAADEPAGATRSSLMPSLASNSCVPQPATHALRGLRVRALLSPCRLARPSLRGAAASMSAADGASTALIAGFAHATACPQCLRPIRGPSFLACEERQSHLTNNGSHTCLTTTVPSHRQRIQSHLTTSTVTPRHQLLAVGSAWAC